MTDNPLADIGRLGLDTAAAVVERLLDLTRTAKDLRLPLLPATADGDAARRLRADAERLVDLYAEWTRSLVDAAISMAASAADGSDDVLVLGPVAAGAVVTATTWLHASDGTRVRPRATTLERDDGATIAGTAITFDPPEVTTSGRLSVSAAVPATATPGLYRGNILAAGLPEIALPVSLTVIPQA
jgi:hypothetical protein